MYLISLDPGITTGVALFKYQDLQEVWTFKPPYDALRALLRRSVRAHGERLQVLVERGPTASRHNVREVAQVEQVIREETLKLYWVFPSTWKPHPAAKLRDDDAALVLESRLADSIHAKDAVRMGRYFLATGGHDSYERVARD